MCHYSILSLESLNLSGNQLSAIEHTVYSSQLLSHLRHLDLSSNRLRALALTSTAGLRTLRLYGNRWRCDCKLRALRESLRASAGNETSEGVTGGVDVGEGVATVWLFGERRPQCYTGGGEGDVGVKWEEGSWACAPLIEGARQLTVRLPNIVGEIRLHCRVSGDPAPLVRWYEVATGRRLADSRHNRWSASDDFALTTRVIGASAYACLASNAAGNATLTYEVGGGGVEDANEVAIAERERWRWRWWWWWWWAWSLLAVGVTLLAAVWCWRHCRGGVLKTQKVAGNVGKETCIAEIMEGSTGTSESAGTINKSQGESEQETMWVNPEGNMLYTDI